MKYEQIENKIVLSETDSFDIGDILECGQCFRFVKLSTEEHPCIKEYIIIAFGRVLHVKQDSETVELYPCDINEFEKIWTDYFDLHRDYSKIKDILRADPVMEQAISFADGIRILNADVWECLISFIISQNNRIPMIKQVIKNLSEVFGERIGDFYSFPTPAVLANASQDELAGCKTGFRNRYINDAACKIASGEIKIEDFKNLSVTELRETLMSIKGVGMKVSDCVMLFSCGRNEVFPTDVWIKRIVQELYFNGREIGIKQIHEFAREKFGAYAGFAEQYLFHYARVKQVGVK